MPYCKNCHNEFSFSFVTPSGYCKDCAQERGELLKNLGAVKPEKQSQSHSLPRPNRRALAREIPLTTETFVDIPIRDRLGIVSAEAVVGMNIFKDFMLEIRDLVGGRSKAQQDAMNDIKKELFDQLRLQASEMGANMIIAVSLNFSDFGGRGSAILATAVGTAVKIMEDESTAPQIATS